MNLNMVTMTEKQGSLFGVKGRLSGRGDILIEGDDDEEYGALFAEADSEE